MKTNQNSSSLVKIFSIILFIGLLGVAGWLVYGRQKGKNPDSSDTQTNVSQQAISIPSDWQWFVSKDNTTKFAYPKSWGNLESSAADAQDSKSFIGPVVISSKNEFLTRVPKGFPDYTWYRWSDKTDILVSAVDTSPPDQDTGYDKPVALGAEQAIKSIFEESKGRAIYEVQGNGVMNCGAYHYFFSVKDKVIEVTANLCDKDGELKPQEGQAYKDEVITPLKDFYKYIER